MGNDHNDDHLLSLAEQLVDALAERLAERLAAPLAEQLAEALHTDANDRRPAQVVQHPTHMTVSEACEYLRISLSSIHRLKAKGELVGAKLGGRVIYRKTDLDAYVTHLIQKTD